MTNKGTLIFFCGKMAAGKSTLAKKLASNPNSILLSEDQLLAGLYPDAIRSLDDYILYSRRLKLTLQPHIVSLLETGVNVVMDFPGNTRTQRAWFREVIDQAACPHELIYLDRTDATCLDQLAKRRQHESERAQFDNEKTFHAVTAFFKPPEDDEGFLVKIL